MDEPDNEVERSGIVSIYKGAYDDYLYVTFFNGTKCSGGTRIQKMSPFYAARSDHEPVTVYNDGVVYAAYVDKDQKLNVIAYDGVMWHNEVLAFTLYAGTTPSIATDGTAIYVCFWDENKQLRVLNHATETAYTFLSMIWPSIYTPVVPSIVWAPSPDAPAHQTIWFIGIWTDITIWGAYARTDVNGNFLGTTKSIDISNAAGQQIETGFRSPAVVSYNSTIFLFYRGAHSVRMGKDDENLYYSSCNFVPGSQPVITNSTAILSNNSGSMVKSQSAQQPDACVMTSNAVSDDVDVLYITHIPSNYGSDIYTIEFDGTNFKNDIMLRDRPWTSNPNNIKTPETSARPGVSPCPPLSQEGLLHSNWMVNLVPYGTSLYNVNLPGTHDSVSYYYAGPYSQNQRLSITSQLHAGVRLFDIRIRVIQTTNENDEVITNFGTCHGLANYQSLESVLDEWAEFLEGRKEAIVALFQVQRWGTLSTRANQMTLLKSFFDQSPGLFVSSPRLNFKFDANTQGKVYGLSRVSGSGTGVGDARFGVPVNWMGDTNGNFMGVVARNTLRPFSLYVQDWWATDDIEDKVKKVFSTMDQAEQVVINFCSAHELRSEKELNVNGRVLNGIAEAFPKSFKPRWIFFDYIQQQYKYKYYSNTTSKLVSFKPTPADVVIVSNDTSATSLWKVQWLPDT